MTGHEFIFSERRDVRLFRHLVFWLGVWLYGAISYYFIQEPWMVPGFNSRYISPGSHILLKTLLLVIAYMVPCYGFINVILPKLMARQWTKALLILIPLGCLMYGLGRLMYWKVFPFVDSYFGLPDSHHYPTRFWPAIVLGFIEPLKIIAIATVITYGKHWWSSQKAKKELEQEKLETELQLLKTQISPVFLCNALDCIYESALKASARTPELLMKLSDLLSYMVYECEKTYVPLGKEIERLKDFISLEELCFQDRMEIGLTVNGNLGDRVIAPFLLLPFIEYSLKESCETEEQSWLNIGIQMSDDLFTMKLASNMDPSKTDTIVEEGGALDNVQKRLSLLYPLKHELKISRESEMFIVLLKIKIAPTLKQIGEDQPHLSFV